MLPERRLLLVHAHPDDESSQSAATMARYLDEGAQVTLVTCTLGELGEILVPELQHFTPQELGAHRMAEIQEAMQVVGVTDHVFLGGPGRYHDSGMVNTDMGRAGIPDEMPDNAFWLSDLLEAADYLVEIIRSRKPQVAVTYDPHGNYGHPDHIKAHRALMYAVQLAASPSHRPDLGAPWQVQRVLWNTHNTGRWAEAYAIARERGIELWEPPADEDSEEQLQNRFGPDPDQIVATIQLQPYLDVCRKALLTHRSQVDPTAPFWKFFAIMQELPEAAEAYLLGAGKPFSADVPATCLFDGLDPDPA